VQKRLSDRKGAKATYAEVARYLGITVTALGYWRDQRSITSRQVSSLLFRIEKRAVEEAERNAIRPIVEFYPIKKVKSRKQAQWDIFSPSDQNGKGKHPYTAGLREQLDTKHGIYVFYDSRGRALYVGKTTQQSLWREMNSAFNRERTVQQIRRVDHPEKRVVFRTSDEKRRQIRLRSVKLHHLAMYFSAYCVSDRLIGELESLLIRSFPNDLLNSRMENLGWMDKG
jgi:hypothetical protein